MKIIEDFLFIKTYHLLSKAGNQFGNQGIDNSCNGKGEKGRFRLSGN